MRFIKRLALMAAATLLASCSTLAGAKLLFPEHFGMTKVDNHVYIEAGASDATKAALIDAMAKARVAVRSTYGSVESQPVVNVCITDDCYSGFGGMGSKAKVYGNYILLSPRGMDWHFLAHEWSHDEIRTRLTTLAWWRLPQWFDDGLAVTVSRDPNYSDTYWNSLVAANVKRPTRKQLMSYRTLKQWLHAVHEFGATQNREREARGEQPVRPVYTAAGHEVRPWFRRVGTPGLLSLISNLNEGKNFDELYPEQTKKITGQAR